jgi:hypothetical protein
MIALNAGAQNLATDWQATLRGFHDMMAAGNVPQALALVIISKPPSLPQ